MILRREPPGAAPSVFLWAHPSVKRDEGNGEAAVGMVGGGVFEGRGDFGEGGFVAGAVMAEPPPLVNCATNSDR